MGVVRIVYGDAQFVSHAPIGFVNYQGGGHQRPIGEDSIQRMQVHPYINRRIGLPVIRHLVPLDFRRTTGLPRHSGLRHILGDEAEIGVSVTLARCRAHGRSNRARRIDTSCCVAAVGKEFHLRGENPRYTITLLHEQGEVCLAPLGMGVIGIVNIANAECANSGREFRARVCSVPYPQMMIEATKHLKGDSPHHAYARARYASADSR